MKRSCLLFVGILIGLSPTWCQAGIRADLNGKGSFGVSLGAMRWLADEDAREFAGDEHGDAGAAQIRPIARAVFRYRMNSLWALSVEAGFGWNSYPDSDDLVLWVIPLTAGLERRIGEISGATTSLSFGAGVYVWGLRRHSVFLIDRETQRDYHATDPGVYLGLVSEFHLSDRITFMGQVAANYIYSAHRDDFKDRMGGDDLFADLRIGVNYYFSPYEGLARGETAER